MMILDGLKGKKMRFLFGKLIKGVTFINLETNKVEYSEFLSKPFIKELSFRKLICQDKKTDLTIL